MVDSGFALSNIVLRKKSRVIIEYLCIHEMPKTLIVILHLIGLKSGMSFLEQWQDIIGQKR